ncbi:tetratricopeptide repeat protein [Zymomonas mobilis]|uniref:tetratricopeptide repeat protein n=1 Tax=Zymomonas mobilis TaxID=542 RepID=UPI0039EBF4E3
MKGEGVAKNPREAVSWFQKAADQGNLQATTRLGLAYASGEGVPASKEKAVFWLKKAAGQGEPNAQRILSMMR